MKKGVLFLSCLIAICMVGCNSGEPKEEKVDSVVDISLGDWLSEDAITELCRVTNIPFQAKILYSNGNVEGKNNKDSPSIITKENKRTIGEVVSKDIIFKSVGYDLDSGDVDTVSYSISDSWSKIKEDEEFTKYSDNVVYLASENDSLGIHMCVDEKADKVLNINASFNKTNMDDKAKVKMLLDNVNVVEKDIKELETREGSSISQEDLRGTFIEKYNKATRKAEDTNGSKESEKNEK